MPYLKNIKYKSTTIPSSQISSLGTSSSTSPINSLEKISSKTTKVAPKGLDVTRTYTNVTYTWSDDFTSCTASAVQGGTNAVVSDTGVVSVLKTIQSTHAEDGSITYAAKFTKKPFELQMKVKTLPAVGHNYGTPTYTWDEEGKVCTAKRVCPDDSIFEEEIGTMTYTVKQATCTEDGRKTATATFLNTAFATQTNDYEITESLGHNMVGYDCTRCGYNDLPPGLYNSNDELILSLTVSQVEQDRSGCIIPNSWVS